MDRNEKLEKAVLAGDICKAAELCKPSEFTARALGIACRFCGLDMVKALVERGASFECRGETEENSPVGAVDRGCFSDRDYSLMLIERFPPVFGLGTYCVSERKTIPAAERVKIAEYLLGRSKRVRLRSENLLYFSVCYDEPEIYELLKKHGASIPMDVKIRRVQQFNADNRTSIGAYRLTVRECGLDLFNKYTRSKIKLLRYLIDNDAADCLAELENCGWFKQPKKRDELIQYASEHRRIECTAWLLGYKNRTADLAVERAKAEKKMLRELRDDLFSELTKL